MFGISVYLSHIDTEYILKAARYGAQFIFTSLHIPEEPIEAPEERLKTLLTLAKAHDMHVIPDISPYTFEKLKLHVNDFEGLKALGIDTVRLDFGFEDVRIVKHIATHFDIVLNASLVDGAYLKALEAIDFDFKSLYLMHNFYPRQDTGLSRAYFEAIHADHVGYGLNTLTFVVGDVEKRLPLFEGLPTLEAHRDLNPFVAAMDFMIRYGITGVLIGDPQADPVYFEYLHRFIEERVVTIPVHLMQEYKDLYHVPLGIRQDGSDVLIRLALPRKKNVAVKNNNRRARGSIVMDNHLAGRYAGEVQLLKQNMPFTARSNNIGWVAPEYVDLLDIIDSQVQIMFVPIS